MATTEHKPFKFSLDEVKRLQGILEKDQEFAARVWAAREDAGLVALRFSLSKRQIVGLYRAAEFGDNDEDENGKPYPYLTLCLLHHCLVFHRTRYAAESVMSHPGDYFCDGCRDHLDATIPVEPLRG